MTISHHGAEVAMVNFQNAWSVACSHGSKGMVLATGLLTLSGRRGEALDTHLGPQLPLLPATQPHMALGAGSREHRR